MAALAYRTDPAGRALWLTRGTLASAFRPDPRFTVDEWADKYRRLTSVSSAESGRWRTDRTPYLREIMQALSVTSTVFRVVFCKGAQVGGTEAGNNWIGCVIAHTPRPMLCLMSTDKTAADNVRTRIDPLIDSTPAIRERVPLRGSKDGGNTLTRKDFPGGMLAIRGANAPANLRSLPIACLFLDEVDAYQLDLGGEGDPVELALARARTYGARRKEYMVSTPTIEGRSRIWTAFEETDQRRYFVPCPDCGDMQTIEWERIRWDDDQAAPYLVCETNGCIIEERHKGRMLAQGEWRATAECADPNVRGYHVSALYSPLGWYSWKQARDDYMKAKASKDPSRMKTFVNTVLGLCYAESGEAPPWEPLYARRESYERNKVPAGGLVLTAAADVQQDRIEVEVRAWGPRLESWSIDHRVFAGDPARLEGERSPWPELEDMLSESWEHELGGHVAISCMALDTGHHTQTCYNWARRFPTTKVMAVKGDKDKGTVLLSRPRRVDVRSDGGQVFTKAVQLWMVSSSVAKTELYGWLRQPRPETPDDVPTGYMHFPESYDEEWFQQLTAEQLVTRFVRGYAVAQWEKVRLRNEALDLHVYNRAAAAQIGIDRWDDRRWDMIRKAVTREKSDGEPDGRPPTTASIKVKRRKSKYWP